MPGGGCCCAASRTIIIGLKFIPHLCCANNSKLTLGSQTQKPNQPIPKIIICSLSDNFDALRTIGAGCVIIYRNLLGCRSGCQEWRQVRGDLSCLSGRFSSSEDI